jgi:hypothetical protein
MRGIFQYRKREENGGWSEKGNFIKRVGAWPRVGGKGEKYGRKCETTKRREKRRAG